MRVLAPVPPFRRADTLGDDPPYELAFILSVQDQGLPTVAVLHEDVRAPACGHCNGSDTTAVILELELWVLFGCFVDDVEVQCDEVQMRVINTASN